jgi:hypothetical protein
MKFGVDRHHVVIAQNCLWTFVAFYLKFDYKTLLRSDNGLYGLDIFIFFLYHT